ERLLNSMGLRQRAEAFDARRLFDFPANPAAMALLIIQQRDMTLARLVEETAARLRIPGRHIVRFIQKYKEFKQRENPDPIHPYLIEAAKLLPHFFLMGLGALVWYNQNVGDRSIIRYLWDDGISKYAFTSYSFAFGVPLLAGLTLSIIAHLVQIYL